LGPAAGLQLGEAAIGQPVVGRDGVALLEVGHAPGLLAHVDQGRQHYEEPQRQRSSAALGFQINPVEMAA